MAARFRALRRRLRYNQQGMGAMAGIDQRTWSEWERSPPKQFASLTQLAQRTGVSADWILGLSADPVPVNRIQPGGVVDDEVWPEWEGDVLEVADEMSDDGRALWLRIGAVVLEAERAQRERLRELYMRMVDALADDAASAVLGEALALVRAGDRAGALATVEAFFAETAPEDEREEAADDV